MENEQQLKEALKDLSDKKKEDPISSILEDYLCKIANTGITELPWSQIKTLVSMKMDIMVDEFHAKFPCKQDAVCPNVQGVTFEEMKKRLHTYLSSLSGIPFTIQRLCDLLSSKKVFTQYKNVDKYMRGLEKNLMIVTTVDPFGRRIVNEAKTQNGLMHEEMKGDSVLSNCALKSEAVKESSPRKSTASWFSCLSDVVESPHSYPTWNHPAKADDSSPLSSQFKRMGNGDLKDPDSNIIFGSKFKSLSTDDDFETTRPVSKVIKLDESALKEEELKKNADKQQSTPLLSELLNSSSSGITQTLTHSPLTVVCTSSPEKKNSDKKNSPPDRKSPILATSTHQSEGVPTNVVRPLQKSEDQGLECEKVEVEKEEEEPLKVPSEDPEKESLLKKEEVVNESCSKKVVETEEEALKSSGDTKVEIECENQKETDAKQEEEFSEVANLKDPPFTVEPTNVA